MSLTVILEKAIPRLTALAREQAQDAEPELSGSTAMTDRVARLYVTLRLLQRLQECRVHDVIG